jgi:hypothetical protein
MIIYSSLTEFGVIVNLGLTLGEVHIQIKTSTCTHTYTTQLSLNPRYKEKNVKL